MNRRQNRVILILIILVSNLFPYDGFAQIPGSMFMSTDNFYAQIYNPAYRRSDKVSEFTITGLGGFSFINQGNFKISDLIVLENENDPVLDFRHFYENSNPSNFIRENISVPVLFVNVPFKKGSFSFYYKENVSALTKIDQEILGFLTYGNQPEEYRNFDSGYLKLNGIGYREFAFGWSAKYNSKLDFGIRGKILFGASYYNTIDWVYGIDTNGDGTNVKLMAEGRGGFMAPVTVTLNTDNTINTIDPEGFAKKYFKEYGNPGVAFDLGINYTIDRRQYFSAAVRDLGGISFNKNNWDMNMGGAFDFYGFDITSAVRFLDPYETDYVDPDLLVEQVKDSIVTIYNPLLREKNSFYVLPPKMLLHYQNMVSDRYGFGITNQSVFQSGNISNVLTATAFQKWHGFSFFESLNLHGFADVTVGAGLQYEGRIAQIFAATDDLFAFYHPAANKTFSLSFGMCFLIGKEKEAGNQNEAKFKGRKGKASEYLPFYEEKR